MSTISKCLYYVLEKELFLFPKHLKKNLFQDSHEAVEYEEKVKFSLRHFIKSLL